MTDGPERLLTMTEVAEKLNVKHTTVSRWVKAGYLQSCKFPGTRTRRIPESEFVRFWNEHFEHSETSET